MSAQTDHVVASADRAAPPGRRATRWALLSSSLVATLTGVLLAAPAVNAGVYLPEGLALGRPLLPGAAFTAALLGMAVLGVAVALLALARPERVVVQRLTTVVAVLQVVTFGLLAQGSGTLSTFGYLTGFAVPLILVLLGVQLFRTHRRARLPVLVVAVAAGALLVVGRDVVATYVSNIAPALLDELWRLVAVLLTLGSAAAWVAVLLGQGSRAGLLARGTRWVTRHRVLFTVLAALGSLPYGVARLSWLTPWPLLGGDATADPAVRLQGLLIGSGAWLGVVLTLGLIARWGEVFPRWFPGYGGRPVPPLFAIIPGGVVALMLCGSAIPLLQMMGVEGALIFPAWFWGPTLALAVWGYAGHRAGV